MGAHVDPPKFYKNIELRCLGTKYKDKLIYFMKVYYSDFVMKTILDLLKYYI